jgi:anti-anti-sigma factor
MFSISCEEYGDVIILTFNGEFYLESTDYVEKIWRDQMAKKPSVIGINCRDIKYIDSSAIGIFVKFLHNTKKQKIDMILYDLSDNVRTSFNTSRLGSFFHIMTGSHFNKTYLTDTVNN